MQITFDTTNLKDVQGIRAMLDHLYPRAIEPTREEIRDSKVIFELPVIKPADNPSTGVDTLALFATTAPAAPSTAPAIDRDAEGLPWDARIHSSTKKKTDAGVWQLRKGIKNDPAMLARVKAELTQTLALPAGAAPQTANVAPVFPQAQAAAPAVTLPNVVPIMVAPAIPTAVIAPLAPPVLAPLPVSSDLPPLPQSTLPPLPAPVVVPQPDPTTVAELMQRVGPALANLKMPPQAIQEACTRLSIPSLEALVSANRPDLVTAVWKELQPLTV